MRNILCLLVGAVQLALGQYPATTGADSLMHGAVDMHVHSAPDVFNRSLNDIELGDIATNRKMGAIVLKNHFTTTADRAELLNLWFPELTFYGGIALNRAVGSLNPDAVQAMADLSPDFGKVVWFPTVDAQSHQTVFETGRKGITVVENGTLRPEAIAILDIIKKHDLVLATGHVSKEEALVLIETAHKKGIDRILVTHALGDNPDADFDTLKKMVALGAKIELTYLSFLTGPQSHQGFLQNGKHVSIAEMVTAIKTLGAQNMVLSSDLGQMGNATPYDGLLDLVVRLIQQGISTTDIEFMIKTNPRRLLGIP